MPTQDSLTVIIPTLTNTKGLRYLLSHLLDYRLIVVDNLPSQLKQKLCQAHDNCLYLPQQNNLGFARAINLAFTHVKTDWICILNDDIEFPATPPFEALIKLAKKNTWQAISPLLKQPGGKVENIGYRVLPIGRVELVFSSVGQRDLDGLTAACLLVKSSAFRDIDGFDDRFFAYLEDVDLFLRFKNAGYQFGVANRHVVLHNHMTTSSKMNNFKAKMDLRNWVFVIVKNWPIKTIFQYLPGIILERFRNLSGFLKATWRSYRLRSFYFLPRDLVQVIWGWLSFPLRRS